MGVRKLLMSSLPLSASLPTPAAPLPTPISLVQSLDPERPSIWEFDQKLHWLFAAWGQPLAETQPKALAFWTIQGFPVSDRLPCPQTRHPAVRWLTVDAGGCALLSQG